MRRVLAFPLIALALLGPAGWATAADDDVRGPRCADITSSSWLYSGDGATATVDLFVASASCPSVSYTLVVQDSLSVTAIVATEPARGDGDAFFADGTDFVTLTAEIPVDDRDGAVCLYATTSVGRHVFDRARDAGCLPLIPNGTGGGGGFN